MTVDQLKVQRSAKKKSFNLYVGRRDSIRDIINKIDRKMDDDVQDINKHISSCITELSQGLKGTGKIDQICSDMEAVKESNTEYDLKMSSCRSFLFSEVGRCQGRINTLDSEISSLETQIKAQGGIIYFWE